MTSASIESFNPEPETVEHLSPVAARMMLAAFPRIYPNRAPAEIASAR